MFYTVNIKSIKKIVFVLLTIFAIVMSIKSIVLTKFIFPKQYSEFVEKYAEEYGIEENLIYAIIKTESGFDVNAISNKDAKGLMQISDITGQWAAEELKIEDFSIEDLYEPETNIRIGCWYINRLYKQYDGVMDTVFAAYNAGSGNVSKWLGDEKYSIDGETLIEIPFGETKRYVEKINRYKKIYDYLY